MTRHDRSGGGSDREWPLLLALGLLLGGLTYAIRALLAGTGSRLVYPLDDTYIHMAMGRTLGSHGVWGCTPQRFASASSSPLWTVLLALVYAVTGTLDAAPLLLDLIGAALTLAVADHYLRRQQAAAPLRAATLIGLVLVVPLPAMTLLGMEHVLHLLLTLAFAGAAAFALAGEDRAQERLHGGTWQLALLAAALASARYEGLFLVAVVCGLCVLRGRWRQGIAIGAAAAAPVVALGLVSMAHGSLFLPNSLMIKAGGDGASASAAMFKPIGWADWQALRQSPGLLAVAGMSLAAAIVQAARTRRLGHVTVLVPVMVLAAVALHVHFAFSSAFWVYRYDAYLLGFGVFAAGLLLAGDVPLLPPAPARLRFLLAPALMAGWIAVVGDPSSALSAASEVASASLTLREHVAAAEFVNSAYRGRGVVVNDVGAMAYLADADVLDMYGLCDVDPVLERRARGGYTKDDVQRWSARAHPAIAVVELSWGWVWPHVPDTWRKVAEIDILPEGQMLGIYAVDPELAASTVRVDVATFYGPLAATQGYRIRYF